MTIYVCIDVLLDLYSYNSTTADVITFPQQLSNTSEKSVLCFIDAEQACL